MIPDTKKANDQTLFVDSELKEIINLRVAKSKPKLMVISTGITSSHLGDERNLREFIFGSEVRNYLNYNNTNALLLLIDDSYDPLDIHQLRIGVNKDEALITKFEKYCGMPIKLIPDPFSCHSNYCNHFQDKLLQRLHSLGIFPNLIDTHSAYETGLYDFAKAIVFTKYPEINQFLKDKFPTYTMEKLFYPVCPDCHMMKNVDLQQITDENIQIYCNHCQKSSIQNWQLAKGKFNWKIDEAIKWNIYKIDFEPFYKAYLDPDTGSFLIAKALSKQFFGGNFPEIIEYGQVFMDKKTSFTLLRELPLPAFRNLFLGNRKADIHISLQKVIQVAKNYLVDKDLTYYDYIHNRLPYDLLDNLNGRLIDPFWQSLLPYGQEFSRNILGRDPHPRLPTHTALASLSKEENKQIRSLLLWTLPKRRLPDLTYQDFTDHFNSYLQEQSIKKTTLFPTIRKILAQEHGVPIQRLLFHIPQDYLYACIALLDETNPKVQDQG